MKVPVPTATTTAAKQAAAAATAATAAKQAASTATAAKQAAAASKPHVNQPVLPKIGDLFRYFNGAVSDHFYTRNAAEIGTTVNGTMGRFGYKSEGTAGKCLIEKDAAGKAVPLYRYWNPGNKDHFYTTNANEIGKIIPGQVGKFGYTSEGITCWVYRNANDYPGIVPLYRYWRAASSDHFYTTNAGEIGVTEANKVGKFGYTSEGIAGYIFKA